MLEAMLQRSRRFADQLAVDEPRHRAVRAERLQLEHGRQRAVRCAAQRGACGDAFDAERARRRGRVVAAAVGERGQRRRTTFAGREPRLRERGPARERRSRGILRARTTGQHATTRGIREVRDLERRERRIARVVQRRRHDAVEHPCVASALAELGMRGVEREAERPAHVHLRDFRRRQRHGDVARRLRQRVDEREQQRQRGDRAVVSRHRRAVRAAEPDADRALRRHADRPRIAESVARAGLPREPRPRGKIEALHLVARTRMRLEHGAHDPRGAARQQAAFDHGRIGDQSHVARDAFAAERGVRAHELFEIRADATEDQREVRLASLRHLETQTGMAQSRRKLLRRHSPQ